MTGKYKVAKTGSNESDLPKLSIVTPSYNQDKYLEETICSIISQDYPNLEYIVVDGDSTDKSIEIIQKYEDKLSYWISEPDSGQYEAINKGFRKTDGEIMGWLNSDDKYTPWALSIIGEIFTLFPEIEWLTTDYGLQLDQTGRAVNIVNKVGFNKKAFFKGANIPGGDWYTRRTIQQESTFWRRSLWEKVGGGIDASLIMAGDFELWAKFFRQTDLYVISVPIAGFRRHSDQKTAKYMEIYLKEAQEILHRYGHSTYGRIESYLHRFFSIFLGHKAIPKDRLSPLSIKIMDKLPLFYPIKQCVWTPEGWKIEEAYIV